MGKESLLKEEQYLIDRYGNNITGLIAYGSMAFGKPRKSSMRDYWVLYKDYEKYHARNEQFYKKHLNRKSTVQGEIKRNKQGPNFYFLIDREKDINIKMAVMQEDDFIAFCSRSTTMVVKGRMQKPLRCIRINSRIEKGITEARKDGARNGINLVNREFSFNDFLFAVVSLSYRAELRLEGKNEKVRSIVDKGRKELESIYRPLLDEFDFIEKKDDNIFIDTRPEKEKERAFHTTMKALKKIKWSWYAIKTILKNYATVKHPIRYLYRKVAGEAEKILNVLFIYPFFRKRTALKMLNEYKDRIADHFNESPSQFSIKEISRSGKGLFSAVILFNNGNEEKENRVSCVPLKAHPSSNTVIAKDYTYKFVVVE